MNTKPELEESNLIIAACIIFNMGNWVTVCNKV